MIRSIPTTVAAGALLVASAAAQAIPTGSVVVLRVGDPNGIALSSDAQPVYLDIFDSQSNTLINSIEIPNSASTPPASPSFCQSGFSFTEGGMTLWPTTAT